MSSVRQLLRASRICKTYSAPALIDVSLEVLRGEVHSIVGENGAGKSTLCRIIAGVVKQDSGELYLGGELYCPQNIRDAERRGVRMVMQELNLIPNLSVAENIFLENLPNKYGWINRKQLNEKAWSLLKEVGLEEVEPERLVKTLGVGQQQLVEIAGGISERCDLLILDEPTAALTDPEIERLFEQISRLKAAGVSIIYVSHRIEEVLRISDRVTVLRDGRLVETRSAREFTVEEIVRLMVGREIEKIEFTRRRKPGAVALRVQGLKAGKLVRGVSFEVRSGEVLGFAGLMGSGRTETMRAIFGVDPKEDGAIYVKGSDKPSLIKSPADAVRLGIAMLPENRKEQGLFLPLPVKVNITINNLLGLCRMGGWIKRREESVAANEWRERLSIKCNTIEQKVVELSGGNQQKTLLARWLFKNCDVFILDEPTRGIDVGAKFEIYHLINQLAEEGKAIIFVSSDLKELMAVCDRIAVMSAGQITGVFNRGEWSQAKIMSAALSGYVKAIGRGQS